MAGLYPTVKLVEVQQQFKTLPAFYLTFFGRQINFEEDKIAFDKSSGQSIPNAGSSNAIPASASAL